MKEWQHLLLPLLAMALLLPPTPLPADFRKALRRSNLSLWGTIRVWQNWLDFLRAALGVFFLMQAAMVLPARVPLGAESKVESVLVKPTNTLAKTDAKVKTTNAASANAPLGAESKMETAIVTPTDAPSQAAAPNRDSNEQADALPEAEFNALALKACLLLVVVLVQSIRVFGSVQVVAPVFYLSGLTLMMGWTSIEWFKMNLPISGAFAVAVGWIFAVAGKNLSYQLPAMAVAAAVAGYVLGDLLQLMIACGLILVPLIASVLLKKRLWFVVASPAST